METTSLISCSQEKSIFQKKLKLFGVQLEQFDRGHNGWSDRDESVNSSSASSTVTEKLGGGREAEGEKKFECQYCLKVFANSQGLKGHQNAHKKERLRKKKMQLQARKARINADVQPFYYNNDKHCVNYYDQELHQPQISFGPTDVTSRGIPRWAGLGSEDHISFQQDMHCTFNFAGTSIWNNHESRSLINKASSLPSSKKSCTSKNLDLELGLSSYSIV